MHLRMSGDVLVLPSDAPRSHHLRFALTFANQTTLHFQDARKFGRLYWVADPQQVFASLGAEPLTLAFTPVWLYRQLQHRRRTLKPLLLDQHIIAGLGNIYTDEALYLAGLHPLQNSQQVTLLQAYRLWVAIRSVLKAGIANNGASIDWVYRGGGQQQHFNVYGRTGQACPKCQTSIERRIVGQRSSHFCPVCQPLR
jgi:formamidopyrimidine-DNA glycosylase